jgi:hypothetical protein
MILDKIADNIKNPFYQVTLMLAFSVSIMCVAYIGRKLGILDFSDRFFWMTTCANMLFFAVFNSVSSISAQNLANYWGRSIMSFMGFAVISGLFSYFFSGIHIFDAGSYSYIYYVITFVYLIFLAMVQSMKAIVEFAQKEQWSQPRRKK